MQNVSQLWKDNQKNQIVSESIIEVVVDVADPNATADAVATSTDERNAFDTARIADEDSKNIKNYATLELNAWKLTGKIPILPVQDCGDMCYISASLCDINGMFINNPIIEINFSKTHKALLPGLTIIWSKAYGEYATDFKISAYAGNTLLKSKQFSGNNSITSTAKIDMVDYDKITIEIVKWCLPCHRARISDVFIGLHKVYGKPEIVTYTQTQTINPLSASLPKGEVIISVDNLNGDYSLNNNNGFSKYLMERQRVTVRYGFKLNGEYEMIDGGVYYLSEWRAPQDGLAADLTAYSIFTLMSGIYEDGVYASSGETLYDLAEKVLNAANLPKKRNGAVRWILSKELKSIAVCAPLPKASYAECLQYIANAARCILYQDRKGIIHIERPNNAITDCEITNANSYAKPENSLTKPLKQVNARFTQYVVSDTTKELFNGKFELKGEKVIDISYAMASEPIANITGATLIKATYYAQHCLLTITGSSTATVKITGKAIACSQSVVPCNASLDGGELQIANPLITTAEDAANIGAWACEYLTKQQQQSYAWRADPRLDPMDIITAKTAYNNVKTCITETKVTYNGAFRGTAKGRVITHGL